MIGNIEYIYIKDLNKLMKTIVRNQLKIF